MNKSGLSFLAIAFSGICFISCNSEPAAKEETKTADTASVPAEPATARPVHWNYSEEEGPTHWAELSPVYALCGTGKSQSPIDLLPDASKGNSDWEIEYSMTNLQIGHNENVKELINNGHTIQVTTQEGSSIVYAGKRYHLRQFHFHTPSEHTISGKHSPMEIHFVHQSDDDSLAVIGVLVNEGSHNSNFDQLIKYLPNAPGEKKTYDSVKINIRIHIPKELQAYHYIGSLTTPPCTENVQWIVLKNPITMDKEQIGAFSSRIKNSNRPTQPLNGRKVTMDDIHRKK